MKTNSHTPVLCGTDFSANAGQAATVAARLAAQSGRTLVLIHVADEFNGCIGNPTALQSLVRAAEERLQRESERLKESGATIETAVLTGQVAEQAIMEFARNRPAALLVVSSVSKTAFDRWTVGSVSERLALRHPSPTLVVRSTKPFEMWSRGERPLRVFVAIDFSPASTAALQWVRDFQKLGPCEIVVAHVNFPPEDARRFGIATPIQENAPELQKVLERELRTKISSVWDDQELRIVVAPAMGRPDARLTELAIEHQADLFVTGTSQHQGLSRIWHPVSRGILHHAPMSVLCVPTAAIEAEEEPIPTIRKVLVATDFSALGDRAVRHACSLLGAGGTLILLHVLDPASQPGSGSQAIDANREKAPATDSGQREEAIAGLQALIPGAFAGTAASDLPGSQQGLLDPAPKIRTEVQVVRSESPAMAILQAAERFDADVICLGSHGRSGLSATLLGSVAQKVMAQSQRPIMIVRPPKA